MAWVWLILAGCLEIGWAIGLSFTDGFRRPLASIPTVGAMILSMYLLSLASRPGAIPIGTAYPVWTGIGAVGTALISMYLLRESRDPMKLVCIALIVAGIAGLRFLQIRDDV